MMNKTRIIVDGLSRFRPSATKIHVDRIPCVHGFDFIGGRGILRLVVKEIECERSVLMSGIL